VHGGRVALLSGRKGGGQGKHKQAYPSANTHGTTHFKVVADQGTALGMTGRPHYVPSVASIRGEEVCDFLQSVYGRSTVRL
jgi:hypothetical protein